MLLLGAAEQAENNTDVLSPCEVEKSNYLTIKHAAAESCF